MGKQIKFIIVVSDIKSLLHSGIGSIDFSLRGFDLTAI